MPTARLRVMGSNPKHKQSAAHRGGEAAKRAQTGIMKPVKPDEALAKIVGAQAQPRPHIVKRLWSYIKKRDLQDPKDGRMIRPDPALRDVLGGKQRVSMFEMNRLISAHIR